MTTAAPSPKVQLVDPTGADPGPNPLTLAARPPDLRGQRPIPVPDSRRPIHPDLLHTERRMPRVSFEQLEILVSEFLDLLRKIAITAPEGRRGKVFHSSAHFPA